jgi:hypothetical protein
MSHTDRKILLNKLEQAKTQVEIGSKYQHTKTGGQYLVKDLIIREDDESIQVIYEELSHPEHIVWGRSLDDPNGWIIPTEINGKLVPRFTKIK